MIKFIRHNFRFCFALCLAVWCVATFIIDDVVVSSILQLWPSVTIVLIGRDQTKGQNLELEVLNIGIAKYKFVEKCLIENTDVFYAKSVLRLLDKQQTEKHVAHLKWCAGHALS